MQEFSWQYFCLVPQVCPEGGTAFDLKWPAIPRVAIYFHQTLVSHSFLFITEEIIFSCKNLLLVFRVTSFNPAALDSQNQCVQRAARLSCAISTKITIQRSTETFFNGISVLASSKAEVQCRGYMILILSRAAYSNIFQESFLSKCQHPDSSAVLPLEPANFTGVNLVKTIIKYFFHLVKSAFSHFGIYI